MDCNRCGILIDKESDGGRVLHKSQGLVLTAVEGAALVSVEDILLESVEVLGDRCAWQCGGRVRR